ncbi:MAG: alanine--glyoxylate aminotransferase family protein [Nitrososphaeria archaeon]|nr:alanine--glyoxylate aminotransferase family protein [Nitrososphaeria archaeon]
MDEKLLLMTPGPTEVDPRVIKAMIRPSIYHYDQDFISLYDETEDLLRTVFQTENDIIMLPGSGRTGIECASLSFIDRGEKVLAITCGTFGNWFIEILRVYGADVLTLSFPKGGFIDLEYVRRVLEDDKNIKAIAMVHNETSTAAIYSKEVEELGRLAKKLDKLFMVDTISSMGGTNVPVDQWNVDVCITGAQKALGGLAGVSIVSVSQNAWEKILKRPVIKSFTLDLLRWKQMWVKKERGGLLLRGRRSFPVIPPTHLILALNEALKIIVEEGLENRFRKHEEVALEMRKLIKEIGLELFPEEAIASPTVTAFKVPEGMIGKQIRQVMREDYSILVAGGMDELSEKIIRVGHMGYTANMDFVKRTVVALEGTLKKLGFRKG